MRSSISIIIVLLSALTLQGCVTNKQAQGNIMGGIAGGLLGSQFGKGNGNRAMTALGAVLGGLVGGEVGAQMDEYDKQFAAQASQKALESTPAGKAIAWRNPDNGHSGSVTPVRTYKQGGEYCREFNQKVNIGGRLESAYGRACRGPDGHWRIVN